MNALGQQLAGKGYENTSFYQNCEIEFLNIHNIHKVRDSFRKAF
jgi:myotubularin-related protein 1/2